MRTARNIIAIEIALIEADISTAESNYAYAEGERRRIGEEKMRTISNGMDYITATSIYNYPIGFHCGCAFENEQRIEALKARLNYWKSLDEKCAEEEKLAEAEEDEEE